MSRSFGETSLTTRPPIEIVPPEISSRPGDHAQRGRLAAAGRPDEDEELAVVDVECQAEDGLDAVVVDLVDVVERDVSHGSSSNPPDVECGAVRREDAVEGVVAVQRLERSANGSRDRIVGGARREAEQPLVARLAEKAIASAGHVHVADAAAGERRRSSGAARSSARTLLEERRVPASSDAPRASCGARPRPTRPRARARRRRRPSARPAASSAGRRRRGGARAVPAIVRKRAVSWLSSRFHEWSTDSHGTPARNARIAATDGSPSRLRHADRDAPELLLLLGVGVVAQQPRPERAQEARVVHDAVPAARAEVGAEVVPVLGDEQPVADLLARPLARPRG